jgi:hypothetical protein
MWPFSKRKPSLIQLASRVIDLTEPTEDHWGIFEGGDNFDARFTMHGDVAKGDEILVRMQSGRIARYCAFSCIHNFCGPGEWKVRACICGYEKEPVQIKGLLTAGSTSVRSGPSQPSTLSSGFTEPASGFWKILARDEACRAGADRLRTAGNLRLG